MHRFDENYGLAATQSLKNKDIPEGGAKGTILPSLGASPRLCFEKYVDVRRPSIPLLHFLVRRAFAERSFLSLQAVIDLLIPGQTPGIKERLVDLNDKPELLFFGPDGGGFFLAFREGALTRSCDRGYGGHDGLGGA